MLPKFNLEEYFKNQKNNHKPKESKQKIRAINNFVDNTLERMAKGGKQAWTIRRLCPETLKQLDNEQTIIHVYDILQLLKQSSNLTEFKGVLKHQTGLVLEDSSFLFHPGGEGAYEEIVSMLQ